MLQRTGAAHRMLGRTANDLFWLSRYVERAENMARLAEVGYRIVAVAARPATAPRGMALDARQRRVCARLLRAKHETLNTRDVIDFMLFDEDNPSSVSSCLAAARTNGRAHAHHDHARHVGEPQLDLDRALRSINPASVTAGELPELLDWVR